MNQNILARYKKTIIYPLLITSKLFGMNLHDEPRTNLQFILSNIINSQMETTQQGFTSSDC